jgi:hypothetical protein
VTTGIGVFITAPTAWGVGLALLFGAVWLLVLRPLGWRRPGAWGVFIAGAVLFAPVIAWVQVPLQELIGGWFLDRLGTTRYQDLLLVTGIPVVLLSGLVQEAAKLAPVLLFRWRAYGGFDSRLGLSIGALAGAGFGIYESQWILNAVVSGGWTWGIVDEVGIIGLAPFWERLFATGFHIAVTALAGWGLARGQGWRFYLLASFLHFLMNYSVLFLSKELITPLQIELYVAVFASLLFVLVFLLRRRPQEPTDTEAADAVEVDDGQPT